MLVWSGEPGSERSIDDRIESPVATTVETMTDKAGGRCFQWRDAGGVVYDPAERRAGEFDS